MAESERTQSELLAEIESLKARIAELEKPQQVASQSDAHFRSFMDLLPIVMFVYRDDAVAYVNPAVNRSPDTASKRSNAKDSGSL